MDNYSKGRLQSTMIDIDRYNQISNSIGDFLNPNIKPFLPTPSNDDYKRGYIVRYFTKSATNPTSPIYEVKLNTFSTLSSNPLYITTELDWRISGELEEVKKSNRVSLQIASEFIPKLKLYLPNLLQFYKKNIQRI